MNKKGFSLTEVLVATIIMSMIMGSVLGFVQYAGSIWSKGDEKISAKNYSRMTFELLKQDLLQATEVFKPQTGDSSSAIIYKKPDNPKKYKIAVSQSVLLRTNNYIPSATMRLAKNVAKFNVNRISKHTFEITLQINGPEYEDDSGLTASDTISNESIILLAPGLK